MTESSVAAAGDATEVVAPLVGWLGACWPGYDWTQARVARGCFHEVAVLAPMVVARVSRHGDQGARVRREHGILAALARVELPFALPRNVSDVAERDGRAGMLTTYVAGELRQDMAWAEGAGAIGAALAALSHVREGELGGQLPAPRAWCGGERWPALVRERLLPRLPFELRAVAAAAVEAVLEVERSVPPGLVHGDFGPHNLLWDGGRVAGVIDLDHACLGDPAMDAASLISWFGAAAAGALVDAPALERAMLHRASLTLQLAAAAEELGDDSLRDHALRNFVARARAGTLYDPGGCAPARRLDG